MTSDRPFRARCRKLGWSVGAPILAVIVGVTTQWPTEEVERRLAASGAAIAEAGASGEPWLRVTAVGRDLVADGEAPDGEFRALALSRLSAIPGLRRLVDRVGIVADASPFVWTAIRTRADEIGLGGARPAEIGPRALAAALAPVLASETRLIDEAKAARGAPPGFPIAARYAVQRLGGLSPGGSATLRDMILSVSGEAMDSRAYDSLRAALAHPPEGFTIGEAAILPPIAADFRFSVTRSADGGVALSGNVVSEPAREALRAEAGRAADGAALDDRMTTARGLSASIDPRALTTLALKVAGLMQEGGPSFSGSVLSVSGVAIDAQAVTEIEGLIRDGRPAGVEAGPVILATRPLSPYKTTIRREAGAVTVSGHLPDQAARERLAAALRPRFFHEQIIDKSRLAEGAAPGLAAALESLIGPLSTLSRGAVTASGRSLRLTGESLYRESAQTIDEALARRSPAGWAVSVAVTGPGSPVRRDAGYCKILIDQLVEGRAPRFASGSAALKPEFYPLLDALAALAETCPSERIEIAGHDDPLGAPREQKPVTDAPVVESTASVEPKPAEPPKVEAKKAEAKEAEAKKSAAPKPEAVKPGDPKSKPSAQARATDAKTTMKAPPAPAKPAPDPEPDLPRQRALAIVEYLLKAGVPADRVSAAPAGKPRPEREGVGFALRS